MFFRMFDFNFRVIDLQKMAHFQTVQGQWENNFYLVELQFVVVTVFESFLEKLCRSQT